MLMRKQRMSLVGSVWPLALLVAGCAAEVKSCPAVDGYYAPLYTPVSGNCGTISNAFPVPFEGPNNTKIDMLPNVKVSTEIVMKGCTVRMTQTVEKKAGGVASMIDGESINIMSADQLAGRVTVTLFNDQGQPACSGTYDATFNKNTVMTGGAASSTVGGAAM
jgi:hypothetical protein